MKNKPIIIIGAGISGLTLGLALLKKILMFKFLKKKKKLNKEVLE